jgi:hypothetical protein
MIQQPKSKELEFCVNESKAALALGISPRALGALRRRGAVPFVRLGGRVLYSIDALRQWVIDNSKPADVRPAVAPNQENHINSEGQPA